MTSWPASARIRAAWYARADVRDHEWQPRTSAVRMQMRLLTDHDPACDWPYPCQRTPYPPGLPVVPPRGSDCPPRRRLVWPVEQPSPGMIQRPCLFRSFARVLARSSMSFGSGFPAIVQASTIISRANARRSPRPGLVRTVIMWIGHDHAISFSFCETGAQSCFAVSTAIRRAKEPGDAPVHFRHVRGVASAKERVEGVHPVMRRRIALGEVRHLRMLVP